jgi:hypothetical protein
MSSYVTSDDNGGFVIFSGNKPWYSSKDNIDSLSKSKVSKNTTKVRASAKNKRIVEFPFFDELFQLETDPFWKDIFDNAAQGKFHRNFQYQNGVMTYKNRSRNIEQQIPKSPEEAIVVLKKFFLNNAGMESPDDIKRKKEEESKVFIEKEEELLWTQIRSEKQKMIMISLYVEELGDKYSLSIEDRKGLLQNIKIGILAGYLNSENISLSGNSIQNIEGLIYDYDTKKIVIDKKVCSLSKIKTKYVGDTLVQESGDYSSEDFKNKQVNKQDLIKNWNRFIIELEKKR